MSAGPSNWSPGQGQELLVGPEVWAQGVRNAQVTLAEARRQFILRVQAFHPPFSTALAPEGDIGTLS